MNEKRFILKIETTGDYDIYDNLKHDYLVRDGSLPVNSYAIEIINLLNELNDENEQLKKQLSKYDKLKISIFNKDKGDWKWNDNNDIILNLRTGNKFYLRNSGAVESLVGLLNEQQATIRKLQDLCGESDGENAKLRIENKQLRKQQQRLYNYFRNYLEDEMSAENFGEMWDNVKEDERWNE